MAHTCPICGATCYCNGDIDDICLDREEDINACVCCDDMDDLDDCHEDDDYPFDDDQDGQEEQETVKLGCTCARRTDEFHGWHCTVSGSSCMFLIPSSEACAKEYGEGPDADKFDELPY